MKTKLININTNKIKIQMAMNGVCKPISMLISYIYVPIVLAYLGDEKYGIWATILSILSWISYFDIGIGNGLRNKLTESICKNDGKEKKYISSSYFYITIIMIITVLVFSFVACIVDWNKIFGVHKIKESITGIIIISMCFVSFNFILSLCKNVLYALQKSVNVSIMELSTQIINLIGVLLATKLCESNLFVMTIIYGISMTIVNIVASIVLYTRNPSLKPSLNQINTTTGKEITNLGIQFFIIQICALVLFTTDNIIISILYGAKNVTPYNIINKLFQVIIGVYNALILPIWSGVSKLKAENKYVEIKNLIKKMNLFMIPFFCGSILLAFLIKPITNFWLGRPIEYSISLVIFACLYCILTIWCNTYASISNGLQIMKPTILFAILQAIINIPLSLLLAKVFDLKVAGVLGGTVGSMLIAAIAAPIIINIYIKKYYETTN